MFVKLCRIICSICINFHKLQYLALILACFLSTMFSFSYVCIMPKGLGYASYTDHYTTGKQRVLPLRCILLYSNLALIPNILITFVPISSVFNLPSSFCCPAISQLFVMSLSTSTLGVNSAFIRVAFIELQSVCTTNLLPCKFV